MYATLQNLIDRYGNDELTQLTDRTGTGSPDENVADVAIGDAGQVIDAYLGSRYQLPLNPVPAIVVTWCCQIARFYLWKDQANDAVMALYTGAIKQLGAVQNGAMLLEAANVETPLNSDTVELSSSPRVFGTDSNAACGNGWGGF